MDKSPDEGTYRAKEFDAWPGGGVDQGNGNIRKEPSSSQGPQNTQLLPNVKPVPLYKLVSSFFDFPSVVIQFDDKLN